MEIAIGRAGDRDLHIDAQELVTGRTCVIAQSGAGKSWGIAVLCERLCRSYIGFCLIDTEGEYFSLKDRFPILWIGADPACDEDIMKADIREIMRQAILCSTPVVFDVSEVDMRERANALANILYDLESELRKPYLLIVEEADKFIPQSKDSIKKIEEISRRGRKRGLGLLVATQRPSLVVKNVLSQCNSQIIGKLSIDNDLKAVAHFFNSRREVEELIDLEPGEFFVMGGITREKVKMKFGDRETMHRGLTPRLVPGEPPAREAVPEIPCPPPPAEPPAPEVRPAPLPDLRQKPENAIVAELQREEALEIARGRCRRSLLTRTPLERIASVELVFWPLLHAEVKYLGGMLRKTTKTASFIVDGLQGNGVDVNYGLAIRPGFRELIGLDEEAVAIVSALTPGGSTVPEIEADTGLKPEVVRKAVRQLEKKKLITAMKTAGGTKVYVPLLVQKVPRLPALKQTVEARLGALGGIAREAKIGEKELRTVLKGLEPTSEIAGIRTLYYPVYEVVLESDKGERALYLDGVTGKEIPLQFG